MYSEKSKIALLENVQKVKDFLNTLGMGETPFYIAGGSVFSTINDSEYDDIDIYFYKYTDVSLFSSKIKNINPKYDYSETSNAVTIVSTIDIKVEDCIVDEHPLQFIKCIAGDPYSVLNTFDINCCKICITSKGEIVIDGSFSSDISVDMSNFKTNSLQRVFKYINRKNAHDKAQQAQHIVIDFLVNNLELQMKESYVHSNRTCLDELRIALGSYHSKSLHSYVHDKICEVYGEEDRIKYFEQLIESMCNLEHKCCDEYLLCKILYSQKNSHDMNTYCVDKPKMSEKQYNEITERIMDKYAEYFI